MSMPSADECLERLVAGNARYVGDATEGSGRNQVRRAQLVQGQEPWAVILSCTDSRVAPEILFDTGLGDLFVVRVAGNIANTSSIASVEFAVANLGTPLVVVLGHQGCGAVAAALAGGEHSDHLSHLLSHIEPAKGNNPNASLETVVQRNTEHSAECLHQRSSIISNRGCRRKTENSPGLLFPLRMARFVSTRSGPGMLFDPYPSSCSAQAL